MHILLMSPLRPTNVGLFHDTLLFSYLCSSETCIAALQMMREENPDDILESEEDEVEENEDGDVVGPPQSSSPGLLQTGELLNKFSKYFNSYLTDEDEVPFVVQRSPIRATGNEVPTVRFH